MRTPDQIDRHFARDRTLPELARHLERRIQDAARRAADPHMVRIILAEDSRMVAEIAVAYRRRGGRLPIGVAGLLLAYEAALEGRYVNGQTLGESSRFRRLRWQQRRIARTMIRLYA